MALPPKLYFRIGEVAGLVGVEPHVLRYWEREFRSIRPTKSAKGQRVYSRKDVEALLVVKDLLYSQGFTIAGAKKRLTKSPAQEGDRAEPARAMVDTMDGAPPTAMASAMGGATAGAMASAMATATAAAMTSSSGSALAHGSAHAGAPAHVMSPAHAPAPVSAPTKSSNPAHPVASPLGTSREKLSALRSEVEAFLRELGG